MSDTLGLLRGLALGLNTHLTMVRRYAERWEEGRLRQELAKAAALIDRSRYLLGEDEIARQAEALPLRSRRLTDLDPAAGYALWAESYHEQADNPLTALEEPTIEPLLREVAGKRVLDVGCGTGRHALRLAERGALVTGVDPCPQMLAVAREQAAARGLTPELREGRFGELPADGSFDLVTCALVLCHLPQIEQPVSEMAACLRPGGRLIITDFHYMSLVIGWRTRFDHGGRAYTIENYVHSYGDYLRAFGQCGIRLTDLEDMTADERLRERGMGEAVDKWEGFPVGMLIAGTKQAP